MSQTNQDSPQQLLKPSKRSNRIPSIDALRGLVMVLMALDHSRDFFGDIRIRPENLETTTVVLFFTRWVTHFCAPTFLFLAGLSAWIYGQKQPHRLHLSWFLISRGIWLLILEFTVVRFGLFFTLTEGPNFFIVIACIGASMILLGVLCWLPTKAVLGIGVVIVAGHNLLDGIQISEPAKLAGPWTLLLRPGFIPAINMGVGYPVLPWFGVMAIGYGLAPWLSQPDPAKRRKFALFLGLTLVASFLLLRTANVYGDPQPWSQQTIRSTTPTEPVGEPNSNQPETPAPESGEEQPQSEEQPQNNDAADQPVDALKTALSFLSTSKYPPSLLFVLMTIGPALLMLTLLDWLGESSSIVRWLMVYGRVPLFFYVLHFYLLHLGAWGLYWIRKGVIISPMQIEYLSELPPGYGFNDPWWLVQVYLGWFVVLAILYPLCLVFGKLKRNGKSAIWSYL